MNLFYTMETVGLEHRKFGPVNSRVMPPNFQEWSECSWNTDIPTKLRFVCFVRSKSSYFIPLSNSSENRLPRPQSNKHPSVLYRRARTRHTGSVLGPRHARLDEYVTGKVEYRNSFQARLGSNILELRNKVYFVVLNTFQLFSPGCKKYDPFVSQKNPDKSRNNKKFRKDYLD